MKASVKSLQAIAACLFLLESCIVNTVVEEIETTVKSEGPAKTGYITITIQNNASNTCLQIDSVEICNIVLEETSTLQKHRGDITVLLSGIQNHTGTTLAEGSSSLPEGASITCKKIKLPQQRFSPWNPNTLPNHSNNQYIKIYGRIYTYGCNGTLILLSSRPMYTPLHGEITENETLPITVSLESNSPIYIENNGEMTKVLQEITFNVSINDWEEEAQ
ncbi:MAG: hypothetical protein IKU18_04205 [Bacteroidales bacterium]|nr:hypothetical protein [Bacteroidales bacterium]